MNPSGSSWEEYRLLVVDFIQQTRADVAAAREDTKEILAAVKELQMERAKRDGRASIIASIVATIVSFLTGLIYHKLH